MLADVMKFTARSVAGVSFAFFLGIKGYALMRETGRPSHEPQGLMARQLSIGATGGTMVMLEGNRDGHFRAEVDVGGTRLRMLVDTGASTVALSAEDAERAGIRPFPGDFTQPVGTANGVTLAAPVTLREVAIGQIRVNDVQALVLPKGATDVSLLGMTFLRRLSSFQVTDNRLVLKL